MTTHIKSTSKSPVCETSVQTGSLGPGISQADSSGPGNGDGWDVFDDLPDADAIGVDYSLSGFSDEGEPPPYYDPSDVSASRRVDPIAGSYPRVQPDAWYQIKGD